MADTLEEALEELKSSDYNTQWSGASFLAKIDDDSATDHLIDALLNHSNDRVRVVSASGLIKHKGEAVVDALIYALHHDIHGDVRTMSASSLSAFDTDNVIDTLLNLLESERSNYNRMIIATSLGKIRNPRAIPALIKALKIQDSQVTHGVASALKEFGELAQSELKKVYDTHPEKVKKAFNNHWGFIKQYLLTESPISNQVEINIMTQEEKIAIREYQPPIREWDCPVCGRKKNELTWYHVRSKGTQALRGSWAIVCDKCDIQVYEYRTRDD